MVELIVTLDVRPDQRVRFLSAIDRNARASRAERGCLRFEVIEDLDEPNRFVLCERYTGEPAFEEHRTKLHFLEWQSAARTCVLRRTTVRGRGLGSPALTSREGAASCLHVLGCDVEPFDRGAGVMTHPYVGSWNCTANAVTTGKTVFQAGTGLPLHTHNVEESALILAGEATVVLDDEMLSLGTGDATWVPRDVPHRFANRGSGPLEIYWVYGGRHVTRTICATGETFAHLSDHDRGATREA